MRLHDFEGHVVHETDGAILVYDNESGEEAWFPRSVIEVHNDREFTVPEDWAQRKGLI